MTTTLEQLNSIANTSGDHDGHIARVVSKAVRRVKLGDLHQGSAKYIIKNILEKYRANDSADVQLVKSLSESLLDKDLESI